MLDVESNIITMENGNQVKFGARARVISNQTISDRGFTLVFNLINGKTITYTYEQDEPCSKLFVEMAAFGAASKAKASTAGAQTIEEVAAAIQSKVDEFIAGNFITRTIGNLSLSLHQEAYANLNSLDKNSVEDVVGVKEHFKGLDAEGRKTMAANPAFRAEVAKIHLAQAQAEVAAMAEVG